MKAWLKGGLIGGVIGVIILIIICPLFVYFVRNSCIGCWENNISMGLYFIIFYFNPVILGIIIGLIISKIKSNKTKRGRK